MTANTMPSKHAALPKFTRRGALSLAPLLAGASSLTAFAQDASKLLTGAPADSVTRHRYKFGGAGLLSGAGGKYGNEFVGLDDSFNIGATVVGAVLTDSSGPPSYLQLMIPH